MSVFNVPSCVLSVHLYVTLLILLSTPSQYYTCMNIPDYFDRGSADFSLTITATDVRRVDVVGWLIARVSLSGKLLKSNSSDIVGTLT